MTASLFFISSGLFLGWSLGANHTGNIWGTAVGTRMIKFNTAALFCSIFVILGAVLSGSGASDTIGSLGEINAIPGAFTVALAVGISVYWMTKLALPVSTSQAIIGAIIGWNLFCGNSIDVKSIYKIVGAWIFSPILSALFSIIFYFIIKFLLRFIKIHLITLDWLTRVSLFLVGIFGSYSLGANNIANVMGVFTNSSPFRDICIFNIFTLSGVQILFVLGGIAIAVGVYTYSKKVIFTVGEDIYKLSPITAFIVILSCSMVLFLFASSGIKGFLESNGLPSFPLVPVSSSQAIVGGVIGIGIAKGGRNVNYGIIGKIGLGWIATPIISTIISFISLFIMQNVFMLDVF